MADADVIVVGAGLAGLVAASELSTRAAASCLDQENAANLGGQAHWSFGGLFFVDSPEQRRMRIKDSRELALQDWLGTAGFDRPEDPWPRHWAEAYVDFAAGEKRAWLRGTGPDLPGRRLGRTRRLRAPATATRCPASTSPGAPGPAHRRRRSTAGACGRAAGHASVPAPGRRADRPGRRGHRRAGEILEPSDAAAGWRTGTGRGLRAAGPGRDRHLRWHRRQPRPGAAEWPTRLGPLPAPAALRRPGHVDGLMLGIAERAGAHVINSDRMWHYTEGIKNWNPIWPARHPHPARALLAVAGRHRATAAGAALPGLRHPRHPRAHHAVRPGHTWFVLNERIIARSSRCPAGAESGSDGRSVVMCLPGRGRAYPRPVRAFMDNGADFVTRDSLPRWYTG